MIWTQSAIGRLVFILILAVIISFCQAKAQISSKKNKPIKNKYEVNERTADQTSKQKKKKYQKYNKDKGYNNYYNPYENRYQRSHSHKNKYRHFPKPIKYQPYSPYEYYKKVYKMKIGKKQRKAITNFIKEIEEDVERKQREQLEEREIEEFVDELEQSIKEDNTIQITITKIKEIQPQEIEVLQEIEEQEQEILDQQCNEKAVYDYNLLVLTWVPTECYYDQDCEKDWLTVQDLQSPTIHMFRPFGSSSYYANCFETKGDQNCRRNAYMSSFDFQQALWNTTGLLYDLSQYWPANKFTYDDEAFYAQQWLNHGTCYLMNMIQDNPNAYKLDKAGFNRTIMIQYFKTTINKFKKLQIDVQPGKQYFFKQQLASDIGFRGKQTHFVLNCDDKNQIVQITFCYNRSKLPGKQVTIPCTFDDNCDDTIPLRLKQPF